MSVKRYLLWFAQDFLPFRRPEIESICSFFNLSVRWVDKVSEKPFAVMEASEAEVKKITSRSVLVRAVYELWASSSNQEDLWEQLKASQYPTLEEFKGAHRSFLIRVQGFGKKLNKETQVMKMEQLAFLPFEGPVDLNNADNAFHLIEFYGLDSNNVSDKPERLFFGRWVADGQRRAINKHSLSERKFISNTTMDPALALIMTNVARVGDGDIVVDPFVGSGSLLVAAAHFGGYVLGSDLDYQLLHGLTKPTRHGAQERAPDESIVANLSQYQLSSRYLDILVADASLSIWKPGVAFDAIITDPPYGIRESSAKIGTQKERVKVPPHLIPHHIPSKISYKLEDIYADLLNFSADNLKLGGRLVYWMPVYRGEDHEGSEESDAQEQLEPSQEIPSHACFQVISTSEQPLTKHSARVMVCMEKVRDSDSAKEGQLEMPSTVSSFRVNYYRSVGHKIKENSGL